MKNRVTSRARTLQTAVARTARTSNSRMTIGGSLTQILPLATNSTSKIGWAGRWEQSGSLCIPSSFIFVHRIIGRSLRRWQWSKPKTEKNSSALKSRAQAVSVLFDVSSNRLDPKAIPFITRCRHFHTFSPLRSSCAMREISQFCTRNRCIIW